MFLVVLVGMLVGLNAVSYVQKEKAPDSEAMPNRSTYNAGATGTRVLYELLTETGRKAIRWQEPPAALLTAKNNNRPAVFVLIGEVRNECTSAETEDLFKWVAAGGRLVLIDREPPKELITTTANWQITFNYNANPVEVLGVDPTSQERMTFETAAAKPVQPTVLTSGVTAVQQSRFASSIDLERYTDAPKQTGQGERMSNGTGQPPPPPPKSTSNNGDDDSDIRTKAAPVILDKITVANTDVPLPSQVAPLVEFAEGGHNLVVEAPFGEGRIVYVADPYIVSNGGIGLVDNAQLAINLVATRDGIVAFDEYHQGYGADSNRFLQFFEGTPVVSIFLQAVLLIGLVFFSQSRRFARPVPEPEPDRLSKLEYVSAMAELQERTRAYDLAIENIYTDFRRRAARLLGVDNYTASYNDLARLIAERTGLDRTRCIEHAIQMRRDHSRRADQPGRNGGTLVKTARCSKKSSE